MHKRKGSKNWYILIRWKGRQKEICMGTPSKRLAEKLAVKVKGQLAEGKYFGISEGANRTFTDLAERYQAECTPKKSLHSQERDFGIFRKHLIPFFGVYLVREIGPKNISRYKAKRTQDGVKPATINKELNLLKASFSVAMKEWEWLESNPVCRVKMEKVGSGRVRYLSQAELDLLYENCSDWLKPMVMAAAHTGLRRGNLLELKWNQVDLFKRMVTIEITKNGDPVCIPISNRLMEEFVGLSKVRNLKAHHVFHDTDGLPIYPEKLRRAFKKACEKSGIHDFRWHDLRHDFASRLVQGGAPLFVVQKLLNHKDGRMTQRYAHLAPENLRDAIKILDSTDAKSDGNMMEMASGEEAVSDKPLNNW